MRRTDVHRPGAIVPSDYECFDHFGFVTVGGRDGKEREAYGEDAMAAYEEGPTVAIWPELFKCDVCGARFVHGAVLVHKPTSLLLSIGQDCAAKYLSLRALPKRERADRAWKRIRQREACIKMRRMLRANPGLNRALKTDHPISRDLRAKAIKWGDLSSKQIELAHKLVAQVAERAKAEVPGAPVPVTDKRATYRGRVLGTKSQEGYYGGTVIKMLVQVRVGDGAFKLWGTAPDSILFGTSGPIKGCEVEFNAKVEVSKDDPCFGFFKRPTKGTMTDDVNGYRDTLEDARRFVVTEIAGVAPTATIELTADPAVPFCWLAEWDGRRAVLWLDKGDFEEDDTEEMSA